MQVAISLLFAGALGNFIDSLFNGEVVDFIDTNIFGYDFPILISRFKLNNWCYFCHYCIG